MPPKKEKAEKRPEDMVKELTEKCGKLTGQVNAMVMRDIVNHSMEKDLHWEANAAKKKLEQLRENLEMNEMEAKLATSCVNTQYKLLQRMFILRVRESREIIARIKKEQSMAAAAADYAIKQRDKEIAEKNAIIEKLESHLNSLHFQLERVVLEMVEKFESRIEQDRASWEMRANTFHEESMKIMKKFGYAHSYE